MDNNELAPRRVGKQSVRFEERPRIAASAAIVGDMEGAGPLGGCFDKVLQEDTWGEDS